MLVSHPSRPESRPPGARHLSVLRAAQRDEILRSRLTAFSNAPPHPFGGLDGLALLDLLRRVRSDVRVLANRLLAAIPEIAGACIFVAAFLGQPDRMSPLAGHVAPRTPNAPLADAEARFLRGAGLPRGASMNSMRSCAISRRTVERCPCFCASI